MKTLSLIEMENVQGGGGCGWAIAGYALATIGIAYATAGVGLVIALATKGVAFGGMLASCRRY